MTTALHDHPREVKRAAQNGLVRITENESEVYVFCSEAAYREKLDEAVERALHRQHLSETLAAGTAAFERDDYASDRSILPHHRSWQL